MATNSMGGLLAHPMYEGTQATSTLVPGLYPIALAGHPYLIDLESDVNGLRGQYFRHESIPINRVQADASITPGEGSLNRDDLWRRSVDDWSHGAGQTYLDRSASDPAMFRSSKGVDPWTKWQLSLLPGTVVKKTSANTNVQAISVGALLYVIDGQVLSRTADLATFTAVTGTPGASALSVCSDGFNVWTAYGSGGVYSTTRGSSTASSFNSLACSLVGYVKGRLMAAQGPSIYNIISGTTPSALFTQGSINNSDWTWVGFAEGPTSIYAAGYSGDKSLIYRTAVTSDATTLAAPVVAGELPDGEIVRCVRGYLGFLIIGSDKGVRLATEDSNGNLTLGGLIPTSGPVRCASPQGRFVWFGWDTYDTTSSGLGRLDLTTFTTTLLPAYASDLMATAQAPVLSVAQFAGTQVFTVSGSGLFAGTPSAPAASGSVLSGLVTYDLADVKVPTFLDVRTQPLTGSYSVSIATDLSSPALIGSASSAASAATYHSYSAGQVPGEAFETTFTLAPSSNTSPVLTRWTLRSYPSPARSFSWTLPLIVHSKVQVGGLEKAFDVQAELLFLNSLLTTRQTVTLQVGRSSAQVFVDDIAVVFVHQGLDADNTYDATVVVSLTEVVAP